MMADAKVYWLGCNDLAVTVTHPCSRDSALDQLVTRLLVLVESRIQIEEGVDVVVEAAPGTDEDLEVRGGEGADGSVLRLWGFAELRAGFHDGGEREIMLTEAMLTRTRLDHSSVELYMQHEVSELFGPFERTRRASNPRFWTSFRLCLVPKSF
ncbi:hypothetical protein L596_021903 [Steinernema carpocapsae]|uniref:Uncharacterized protein n=1 Tax=Steinernema carpocapsae TaxID=34508 RepID=A0A4U5MK60_STECR|nr:hypothetical protein L596_021903 [Steinernema carpocapsae]